MRGGARVEKGMSPGPTRGEVAGAAAGEVAVSVWPGDVMKMGRKQSVGRGKRLQRLAAGGAATFGPIPLCVADRQLRGGPTIGFDFPPATIKQAALPEDWQVHAHRLDFSMPLRTYAGSNSPVRAAKDALERGYTIAIGTRRLTGASAVEEVESLLEDPAAADHMRVESVGEIVVLR